MQTIELPAHYVLLDIPVATLRHVYLSEAGFAPLKLAAIDQVGMGTNTKLHLQFKDRLWYKLGYNG